MKKRLKTKISFNRCIKVSFSLLLSLMLISCGDFPEYDYDRSEDYCVMRFPFAGGVFSRKYIGYLQLISSLQYMDADPTYKVIITGPSDLILETGSVQKLTIDDNVFVPTFIANHLEAELQLWGPTFLFTDQESAKIVALLKDGYDLNIIGRLEIGRQYETDIYNYFFDSDEKPFRACINRLLDENDMQELEKKRKTSLNN